MNRATTYSPAGNSTLGGSSLTSVFGMDTGVASTLWSPGNVLSLLTPTEPRNEGIRLRRAICVVADSLGLIELAVRRTTSVERERTLSEAPPNGKSIKLGLSLSLTGN